MGLVKFYYGGQLPTSPESDALYFLNSGELYKGATLIADATDTIAIQSMIDDAIGGIGKAVRFIGHSSTPITDGGNEIPTIDGKLFTEIKAGDVIFYDNKEFICTATGKWELFGDESNYATIAAFEELSEKVEQIVDGNIQVKFAEGAKGAESANTAGYADNAGTAKTADTATTAVSAGRADTATKADTATEANHAIEADHAEIADTATEADHAGTAGHADTAEKADFATEADHANTANHANTAGALALNLSEDEESVGTSIKPVYFNKQGLPIPIDYSIETSVPKNAVFTDTISTIIPPEEIPEEIINNGNAVTDISVDSFGKFTVIKGSTFALESDLQALITALTWTTV